MQKLTILDKDDQVVESWASTEEAHYIEKLPIGKYTLREEQAPKGFILTSDVTFEVKDTAEIQKVEMKDEVPTGLLIINKNGEFLDKVTLLDNVKGTVEHLFEYVTGSLTDVTFDVFVCGRISKRQMVSVKIISKQMKKWEPLPQIPMVLHRWEISRLEILCEGSETAHGYVLDGEPRYVDLSYRDQGHTSYHL